jgi:molecular chaperone HscA
VEVRAEELTSGVQSTITLKPSYGLKEGQIETMLRDSYASAQQDLVYRKLAEARVEAARHIEALRSALLVDGELLLSKDECAELNALISELDKVATGTNADAIIKLTDNLNSASQTFATRRMDKGIRSALAGHSLDELT